MYNESNRSNLIQSSLSIYLPIHLSHLIYLFWSHPICLYKDKSIDIITYTMHIQQVSSLVRPGHRSRVFLVFLLQKGSRSSIKLGTGRNTWNSRRGAWGPRRLKTSKRAPPQGLFVRAETA